MANDKIRKHVACTTKLYAPNDDCPILLYCIGVHRPTKKKHLCTSCEREPSMTFGILIETSHCLNPGSV